MASRRKKAEEAYDPFAKAQDENPTLASVTDGIFGNSRGGVPSREVIKMIPIENIQPDPAQPRRVAPSVIRGMGIANMGELFQRWHLAANKENSQRRLPELDWDVLINMDDDMEEEHIAAKDYGPIAASLIKVALLARSIKKDGLINPITVVRIDGRDYAIETGERRWWAYNLLALFDQEFKKIPAREVEKRDLWRQAMENMGREDLNAIGRARQFALLIMDLYRQEGVEFKSYEETVTEGCDRAFYAQVADGGKFRIPKGKADLVCGAMGINSPDTLRDFRAILRLDDSIWNEADDENQSWAWILDTQRILNERKRAEKAGTHSVSHSGDRVPHGTVSPDAAGVFPAGRQDEHGDYQHGLAEAVHGFDVLTMTGVKLITAPKRYQPDSDLIGVYDGNVSPIKVEIGLQDGFLIFRQPPVAMGWGPVMPANILRPNAVQNAVTRYRQGDLGEGEPKAKPAQPIGATNIPPAKFRAGDLVQSRYLKTPQRVVSLRWNHYNEFWLYVLEDTSQIDESNLSLAEPPAATGNAQPRKDGVFVPGSGFVPNAAPASSDIPEPPFHPEPGDRYTPESGWVKGGAVQPAPDANDGKSDIEIAGEVIKGIGTLGDVIRWKINSLLSISDDDITSLQNTTLPPLRHLRLEVEKLNEVLAEGLNYSAQLMDYVGTLIKDKEAAGQE
jgi:ParB-like chromosome segregation protein Spo0J